jgi:hypothetical protein
MKFRLPMYALALLLAVALILKTILLLGANPQVDGSAAPLASPVCQAVCTPEDTATVAPQAVRPDESLRYT